MLECTSFLTEMDIGSTSIEQNVKRLIDESKAKGIWPTGRVFYVVYTEQHRLFCRNHEKRMLGGYDNLTFVAKDSLPVNGWDVVMYSVETGEAVARVQNRPEL